MARKSLFWCDKFGRWVCPFVVTYEITVSGVQIEFPVPLKKYGLTEEEMVYNICPNNVSEGILNK
jgi:hypothetical protein